MRWAGVRARGVAVSRCTPVVVRRRGENIAASGAASRATLGRARVEVDTRDAAEAEAEEEEEAADAGTCTAAGVAEEEGSAS